MRMNPVPTVEDYRLDKYIDKSLGPGKCWPWTGAIAHGYGCLKYKRKMYRAHRLVLQKVVPRCDNTTVACHTCDNRACCNPEHLYWGTPKQKIKDMDDRGRRGSPAGDTHPKAKLNTEKAKEIRRLAGTMFQRELAVKFGVTQRAVWAVIHRKTWKKE